LTKNIIEEIIPEIKYIKKTSLRKKVIKVWDAAIKIGRWEEKDLNKIPFTLLIPDTKKTLIEHTRSVINMAKVAGSTRKDVDMDVLIAGAILHDVGKLLEYEKKEKAFVKSEYGKRIRHPISGGMLAREFGLPLSVQHIIVAHSDEGEKTIRTPEATIVYHCDFIDFEIEKNKDSGWER